jgi:hypothetical protein
MYDYGDETPTMVSITGSSHAICYFVLVFLSFLLSLVKKKGSRCYITARATSINDRVRHLCHTRKSNMTRARESPTVMNIGSISKS